MWSIEADSHPAWSILATDRAKTYAPVMYNRCHITQPVKFRFFLLLVDHHATHFNPQGQTVLSSEGLMITPTQTRGTYERFGHFCLSRTPGQVSEILNLEGYLALPGVEDKAA
jgi:hypothetical protein